jgi:hypothetical protein
MRKHGQHYAAISKIWSLLQRIPEGTRWSITLTEELPATFNLYVANRDLYRKLLFPKRPPSDEGEAYETYHHETVDVSIIEEGSDAD